MGKVKGLLVLICLSILMIYSTPQAAPLGTAITYQGRLEGNGQPTNGNFDFQFRLFDAVSGGSQVGATVIKQDIPVDRGLFTIAALDFGSGIFNGNALWLEIGVRPGESTGSFTVLSPLQAMTATPYAIYAANAPAGVDSPWKINGSSIYYLGGNVGLGNNNPSYTLDIRDFGTSPAHQYTLSVESDSSWTIFGNNWNNSASSLGVYGGTHSQAAGAAGVWGCVSTAPSSADGVLGTTNGSGAGVKGTNYASDGYGVYGHNTSQYGGVGVYGVTDSSTGYGVKGTAPGGASGVYGSCSGYGNGVYGYNSTNGPGVRGYSIASNGVWGETSSYNPIDAGVYGKANNAGYGVYSYGNFGSSGHAYISGNLYVSGSKSAVIATSEGNKKVYSQESPEVWFEDFGEGKLQGGKASIELAPLFLETVTIDEKNPLKVFIQLNEDCNGVYVQRRATGFDVKELKNGTSQAQFTYRVVAKRKGFETVRLESAGDNPKLANLEAQ
jgi:hypothetical protein